MTQSYVNDEEEEVYEDHSHDRRLEIEQSLMIKFGCPAVFHGVLFLDGLLGYCPFGKNLSFSAVEDVWLSI